MKTVNAGQLHDYAEDEVAFNSLLVENPGVTIENNVFFHRNIDKLIKSAIKAENYDFIYWVKDHDLPDSNMINVTQIMLNDTTKMPDPQQAAYLQEDIIKSHGHKIKRSENFDIIAWGLLRSGFLNSDGNQEAVASLKEALTNYLRDSLQASTVMTVINESVSKDNNALNPGDLSRLVDLVPEESKAELKTKMFIAFATSNQVDYAKEMVNLGVDPFSEESSLNTAIESPSDAQRDTINTLENYKFSLSDDSDNYTPEDSNTTGSFVL